MAEKFHLNGSLILLPPWAAPLRTQRRKTLELGLLHFLSLGPESRSPGNVLEVPGHLTCSSHGYPTARCYEDGMFQPMPWEGLIELPIIKEEAWRVTTEAPSVGCWSVIMGKLFNLGFLSLFLFRPWHTACGILVPQLGIEPMPPAVEAQSPKDWTSREVPQFFSFWKEDTGVGLLWSLMRYSM